jgi:putative ABC transport system permease protein
MSFLSEWVARARAALRRRPDSDLEEELRLHLEMTAEDLCRRGHSLESAARVAVVQAGRVESAIEALRDQRGLRWLSETAADVRHAVRGLARSPGFATVAITSLALGIGANVVVFSVVDAALLRPLPYRDADRLVKVAVTVPSRDGTMFQMDATGRWHLDGLRSMPQVFEQVEAYSPPLPRALATGVDASPWVGAFTPEFPAFLGVSPQIGRTFTDDDVRSGDAIILSDAYWLRAFNRAPDVVGSAIAFADRTHVVVGVMPPSFRFFVGHDTDGWTSTNAHDADLLIARLRPGLTMPQAQREADAFLKDPAARWKPAGVEIYEAEWGRGEQYLWTGAPSTRTMLFSLSGAAGLLLLIACANIANLLLVRTVGRRREIAMRLALGATRARVVRQFLAEGAVLASAGSAAAAFVAWAGIAAVPILTPSALNHALFEVSVPQLDMRVLAFGCVVGLLTALTSAAGAMLLSLRLGVSENTLRGTPRPLGATRGQRRLQRAFQAIQVAIAVLLLAGAGVLMLSLYRMSTVPVGFRAAGLVHAGLYLPGFDPLTPAQRTVWMDALVDRLRASPGLDVVTAAPAPVQGTTSGALFLLEENGSPAPVLPVESFHVRPEYFGIVGLTLKQGRPFGNDDRRGAPPVAIISELAARRHWPDRSPLGQQFRLYPTSDLLTVVGVVNDVRTLALREGRVQVYVPSAQSHESRELLFRATRPIDEVTSTVRATVRDLDPRASVVAVRSVDRLFQTGHPGAATRFYAALFGLFATIGVMTAAVGLYGLVSYAVSRRTPEIGIRVALGSSSAGVRRLMLAEALAPIAAGVAAGLVATWWATPLLVPHLFRVDPRDPWILAGIVVVFLAVGTAAVAVPVRRAMRIDPAAALRVE